MKNWFCKHWWLALIVIGILAVYIWQMPWIDVHQGSLMVLITIVYVIATVAIFLVNNSSVKAANNQLVESKRQFEESIRIEYAPFLQTSISSGVYNVAQFVLKIKAKEMGRGANQRITFQTKNIGNGSATTVMYECKSEYYGSYSGYLPGNAIGKGDFIDFILDITSDNDKPCTGYITLTWEYNDILGNTYTQKTILELEKSLIRSCETDIPVFRGIIKYSEIDAGKGEKS